MKQQSHSDKPGIIIQKEANAIRKELVRKSIHLATAFIPFFLEHFRVLVLAGLFLVLAMYCIAEFLRMRGKNIILFSFLTEAAARKRDENHFVLGPVTLALGVLLTAFFYDTTPAAVAIYALAFGDGLASLAGKLFGKHLIPFSSGKTLEGSVTCFVAIFFSTLFVTKSVSTSLLIAAAGTVIEVIPIRDFDNIIIPVVIGFISQYYFHI